KTRELALLRFQNDPRPLTHFQMLLGIYEQGLLERSLTDFEVIDPRQDLVRRPMHLDDLEGFVHKPTGTEREHKVKGHGLAASPALGAEGIVAKRRDRPYRSGRSTDWVKVKNPDAPAATRVI